MSNYISLKDQGNNTYQVNGKPLVIDSLTAEEKPLWIDKLSSIIVQQAHSSLQASTAASNAESKLKLAERVLLALTGDLLPVLTDEQLDGKVALPALFSELLAQEISDTTYVLNGIVIDIEKLSFEQVCSISSTVASLLDEKIHQVSLLDDKLQEAKNSVAALKNLSAVLLFRDEALTTKVTIYSALDKELSISVSKTHVRAYLETGMWVLPQEVSIEA